MKKMHKGIAESRALGNNSEIVAPTLSKKSGKWKLKEASLIALGSNPKWKRLHDCSTTLISSEVAIRKHIPTGSTHYANLATCGSVWSCPVCAPNITEYRKKQLEMALDKAKELDLVPYMLTLTVPHTLGNTLAEQLYKVSHARRLMRHRKPWKRLIKRIGLVGSVRSLEVTYGQNGWHVHTHEILFCKKDHINICSGDVIKLWGDACLTAGLELPNSHGVDVVRGDIDVGNYIAKWGMAAELSKSMIKRSSRGNMSPWDMLREYSETGDEDLADLFREYSECFRGKHQLEWSKGLRDFLFLQDEMIEMTDEQIAEHIGEDTELVCFISREVWHIVCERSLRGDLLYVALSGAEAVNDFINSLYDT